MDENDEQGPPSRPSLGKSSKSRRVADSLLERRRSWNRINARNSRIRKKERFDVLKGSVSQKMKENNHLREVLFLRLNRHPREVLGSEPSAFTESVFSVNDHEVPLQTLKPDHLPTDRPLTKQEKATRKKQLNRINAHNSRLRKNALLKKLEDASNVLDDENRQMIAFLSQAITPPTLPNVGQVGSDDSDEMPALRHPSDESSEDRSDDYESSIDRHASSHTSFSDDQGVDRKPSLEMFEDIGKKNSGDDYTVQGLCPNCSPKRKCSLHLDLSPPSFPD